MIRALILMVLHVLGLGTPTVGVERFCARADGRLECNYRTMGECQAYNDFCEER